jgi:phytoene dehydrogenase-like protein
MRYATSRAPLALALVATTVGAFGPRPRAAPRTRLRAAAVEEFDVVVIGSGIGGLSCAGLLAAAGREVCVLEAHYELGGCAHEYDVDLDGKTIPSEKLQAMSEPPPTFKFEAGPSLYSGLSPVNSPNPLKHIYQMIEEEPEWITYDKWGAYLPEAPEGYELSIGADNFKEILRRYGGPTAVADWNSLEQTLRPLAKGVMGIPSTAVRGDAGVLVTLGLKYPGPFLSILKDASKILAPFDMEDPESPFYVKDQFLRNYLDLIAFLLQGLPASGTLTAVMAYMVEDFYREGAVIDFPRGGSRALIEALARGVTKRKGCVVRRSTTVERVIVEDGRAVGVMLRGGKTIRARNVVSNADLKNTYDFVERGACEKFDIERNANLKNVKLCKSFCHVHLGVPASAIPEDAPPQWTVVGPTWDGPIDAAGKVVVVSVPSKLDPSLAPEGYHVIHAYGAGNEPFDIWKEFEGKTNSPEYAAFKEERAKPIFDAIARRAPDARKLAVVEQIASPLTHARFLRRHEGNYGPAIKAGSGIEFPAVTTPLPGYYRCGDSTTAGIGVPAVASSGAQCANALLNVFEQLALNEKIRM